MVDFFLLANLEKIDFTRWSVDGQMKEAVQKLGVSLGLISNTEEIGGVAPILIQEDTANDPDAHIDENDFVPQFAQDNLADLFIGAVEISDEDPERGIFLFKRLLDVNPNYAEGRALKFFERLEKRLQPLRVERLRAQIELALQQRQWDRAHKLGQDLNAIDPRNSYAQDVISRCKVNVECEPLYKQAILAAQKNRWRAVIGLLKDIKKECPDFGDPDKLLSAQAITAELVELLSISQDIAAHDAYVFTVGFSPSETRLVSAGSDNDIKLWDTGTGKILAAVRGHEETIRSVTFHPSDLILASGSDDKTIKLWNTPTLETCNVLHKHKDAVMGLAFSPTGSLLASASADKSVGLWDISDLDDVSFESLKGHRNEVQCVAFDPNGILLASGGGTQSSRNPKTADYAIRVWNVNSKEQVALLKGHEDVVQCLAFSPIKGLLASGGADSRLILWDLQSGKNIKEVEISAAPQNSSGYSSFRPNIYIRSLAFSPDGALLVISGCDKVSSRVSLTNISTLQIIDLKSFKKVFEKDTDEQGIFCVGFNKSGTSIASGSAIGSVKLWSL